MTDKKTEALKLELKRILSIIVQITGLDDDGKENLGDAYRSLGLVIDSLAEQPAIPEGYALISIDVLKAWGKYDTVRDACQYPLKHPAQQEEPQPPYEFERYVAGSLRAQGVRVERATTLADAMRIAAKICPPANPPSAPTVLVYTSPPAQQQESCGWRMRHNGVWAYSFTKDAWDFIYAVSPAARKAARDNAPASKLLTSLEEELQEACKVIKRLVWNNDQQAHKDAGAFIAKHGMKEKNNG